MRGCHTCKFSKKEKMTEIIVMNLFRSDHHYSQDYDGYYDHHHLGEMESGTGTNSSPTVNRFIERKPWQYPFNQIMLPAAVEQMSIKERSWRWRWWWCSPFNCLHDWMALRCMHQAISRNTLNLLYQMVCKFNFLQSALLSGNSLLFCFLSLSFLLSSRSWSCLSWN